MFQKWKHIHDIPSSYQNHTLTIYLLKYDIIFTYFLYLLKLLLLILFRNIFKCSFYFKYDYILLILEITHIYTLCIIVKYSKISIILLARRNINFLFNSLNDFIFIYFVYLLIHIDTPCSIFKYLKANASPILGYFLLTSILSP